MDHQKEEDEGKEGEREGRSACLAGTRHNVIYNGVLRGGKGKGGPRGACVKVKG